MAFDYPTLVGSKDTTGSIKFWLGHELIDAEGILTEAQTFIFNRLRTYEMKATASVSAIIGANTIALPTRFQAMIELVPNGWSEPLDFVDPSLLRDFRDIDGNLDTADEPTQCTILDGVLTLDVELSAAFAGKIKFYQAPAPLATGAASTNFLTTKYPTLLRRACLMYGYEARRRMDDFQTELVLVEAAIEEANRVSDSAQRSMIYR